MIVAGIYHGAGLIAWSVFQEIKRKYPFLREIVAHRFMEPVGIVLTFIFIGFGFIFFAFGLSDVARITARIF
jgi:D-alanyl-lipoteichoic acid acyltransferase DltB (MBOAT superfamily)